jgi:hypothetical protein
MNTQFIWVFGVFVGISLILGVLGKRRIRIDRSIETAWGSEPDNAWRTTPTWSNGSAPAQLAMFSLPLWVWIVPAFAVSPYLTLLRKLTGEDGPEYVVALGILGVACVCWILFTRSFSFRFEDAGSPGGQIRGELTGPWRIFFGDKVEVSLCRCDVAKNGASQKSVVAFEERKEAATDSSIPVQFSVPSTQLASKLWSADRVCWYVKVSPKTRIAPPLAFPVPVVPSRSAKPE